MAYKTIVGLEIHVELSTKTKAFCSCENAYGGEPNTRVCPVCLGLPGALPVLSEEVVEAAAMASLALNCEVGQELTFDRKNYFYPDLTKGYQITQNDNHIGREGFIEVESDGVKKKIGIAQIQIEEDTGKSLHTEEETLMDYNRCGVPLIEIVTKPDISSGLEARLFLEKLRATLKQIGVSDVKMEEGSLRCDVNVNIKDLDSQKRSSIQEVKNLNSFRGVEKAIDYEVARQKALMEAGEEEIRTTRRWDDVANETVVMRAKLTGSDYRFVPEPDLAPIELSPERIEEIRQTMPELPDEKKARFMEAYGLSAYDAEVLTQKADLADFYEGVARDFKDYGMLANWVTTEVLRRADFTEDEELRLPFEEKDFSDLLKMIQEDKINNNAGKKVLRIMFEKGDKPEKIIEEEGLAQMQDSSLMESLVKEVLEENPESVEDYRQGKDRVVGFLVGQVMKKSRGKANPQVVNQLLLEALKK
ncbi:MAG: Asp-tRNA(Asn)/Glu-tRNA(Gln) amidotransferase subunit GatB [Tissierellia bacterium]|nr:Asp-tRNA(Asn)/Glu-tRNA(Gln) amidotransferase subunit GatB [Tissierellia bacterium]